MKRTLDRDDVALMISQEIATWANVKTQAESVRRLRALADRIVNYAHLHYSTTSASSVILPGLPGSQ
jgi:hypothetical protein